MDHNLFNQSIAEVQVSYSHKVKAANRLKITCSNDTYKFVSPNWPDIEYRESFAVLLLNRGMQVLGITWISKGGVSGTVVDAKIIFQSALRANCTTLILIHNHPSGTLNPSTPDINITNKIKDGAKLLDMSVVDHIILSSEGYYSFADEGIL